MATTPASSIDAIDFKRLKFGKYIGETPEQVSCHDPDYVVWMHDNVKPVPCSLALREDCYKDVQARKAKMSSKDGFIDTYDKFQS